MTDLIRHRDQRPALDLLLRLAAVVLVGAMILGLLPLIAELAA